MGLTFEPLGKYVRLVDERNTNKVTESVLGINIDKYFMPSVANTIGTNLSNYKLLRKGRFACNPMHVGRDGRLPVSRYTEDTPAIVSPAYFMFEIIDENEIEPEYLMLCFRRPDFDRMCWFRTDASVRGGITWDDVCALTIPVPSLPEQHKIVHDYQVITDRIELLRKINKNLDSTMQAVYKNYFVDFTPFKSEPTSATKLGEIPASWSVCKLCDLCDLLNGRAYSQEELLDSGKYRVLRVGNFFTKNSWYYSDMELEDNKYCYPDDLLFCWSASFGLYIWNDVKTIYHYHIWKIDFSKTAPYYREYIFLYLKQELDKLSKEGHGSVMAHLTKSGVENLDIVSPPEEIIKQFHNLIIPFIEHKKLVEKEVQQLTELRESILSKMVS